MHVNAFMEFLPITFVKIFEAEKILIFFHPKVGGIDMWKGSESVLEKSVFMCNQFFFAQLNNFFLFYNRYGSVLPVHVSQVF